MSGWQKKTPLNIMPVKVFFKYETCFRIYFSFLCMHWSSEEQIDLFIANKRQLSNLGFIETHGCIFREKAFKIHIKLS